MMMAPVSRASQGTRRRTFFSQIVMAVHSFVKSRSRTNRLSRLFSMFSSTRLKAGFQLFCFAYFIFALVYLLYNRRRNAPYNINIKDFDFSILRKDDDPYPLQFDSGNPDPDPVYNHNADFDSNNHPPRSRGNGRVQTEEIPNSVDNDNDNGNSNTIDSYNTSTSLEQSHTANKATSNGTVSSHLTLPQKPARRALIETAKEHLPTNTKPTVVINGTVPSVPIAQAVRPVKVSKAKPSLVLGFSVHGGLGNQIYDMLEALYLVRHTHSTMLLPELLPRADVDGTVSYRAGTRVWDLGRLSEGTKGQPIYPFIPSRCKNRIHVLYIFIRRNGVPPPVDIVPSEVRNSACSLAKASPSWNPQVSTCDTLFESTDIRIRRQNLTMGGSDEFIRELKQLPRKEKCIWISGHTYDRAGSEGDEYLYSHMHYLKAHPRITNAAKKWPLSALGVVHIRYDEEVCKTNTHNSSYICVRATKDGRQKTGQVYWAPIKEYVQKMAGVLHSEGVETVYLAASPYVPMSTIMELKVQLGKLIRVQRMASTTFDDEADVNFLERELAIESKVFIGDFASTWSGTVYFKRRTQGKTTLWANVVLGKAQNLGYYRNDGPLQLPD